MIWVGSLWEDWLRLVICCYFWVFLFLTQEFFKLHSDSRFYTAARPATNLLMSADLGWIMVGGLVIFCYLRLFVVSALTQEFQKIHSDSRFYTPACPASTWLMSAAPGWILLEGLVILG